MKKFKSGVCLLLALVLMASLVPMAFAEQHWDPIDGPADHDISSFVSCNTTVQKGQTFDVYCQVFGAHEEDRFYLGTTYEWNTNNSKVVKLGNTYTDSDNVISATAVGAGTATIGCYVEVHYTNGYSCWDYSYADVTVTSAGEIEVSPWTKSIKIGETFGLEVTGAAFGARISYYSDNPSIATVDKFGRVTGVGVGTTNVWAESNGSRDACSVNVKGASNVISTFAPTVQNRTVITGARSDVIIKSFDPVYGYYLDQYGMTRVVECPVTWYCTNYNANIPGDYVFTGKITAPEGFVISQFINDYVTANVTVTSEYKLTLALTSALRAGGSTTLTAALTDGYGRLVSSVDGLSVYVALNSDNGTIKFTDKYIAIGPNGTGTTTVTGVVPGSATVTGEAWTTAGRVCGIGVYFTVNDNTYVPFTDIKPSDWFYNDVANAYNMGLINGSTTTTFSPNKYMTYAEAIKLAACMHQYYYNGKVTLGNGSPNWYDSYIQYAKNNGIPCAFQNYNAYITRADYAYIFYYALPQTEYKALNAISAVPDFSSADSRYDEILAFYNAGILTGSDAYGNFNPGSNILRSEVATIISRMMDSAARKSFTISR